MLSYTCKQMVCLRQEVRDSNQNPPETIIYDCLTFDSSPTKQTNSGAFWWLIEVDMDRLGWTDYFMNIAKAVSRRATCPRANCGTVLVDPKSHHILATGYNGSPPGDPHCTDEGCLMEDNHCQRAIHSEMNAIVHAARSEININGAYAYVYGKRADGEIKDVCRECAKLLRTANVTVIACRGDR